MLSESAIRAAWGPPCASSRFRRYAFGGSFAVIRPEAFVALVLLSRALRRFDRAPRATDTWSYSCRAIAGTSTWSLHAYGIAVDVRATSYPWGVAVRDPAMIAAADLAQSYRTPAGQRVWEWGGRWSRPDGMHFQIDCTPAEAAAMRLEHYPTS